MRALKNTFFFSVLRLCGSRQVVAHCRAVERITQMQLLCPALGVESGVGTITQSHALKNTVKNRRKMPVRERGRIGKRESEKNCFLTFDLNFLVYNIFFAFPQVAGPEADFRVLGPVFGLIFVVL